MFCSAWIVNEKYYIICSLFLVLLPLIFLLDKNALFFYFFWREEMKVYKPNLLKSVFTKIVK